MGLILNLETATTVCSVALAKERTAAVHGGVKWGLHPCRKFKFIY